MTTYRYKGQTPEGSKVSGVIRAYDEYDAVSKLRDTCAFVIKLEEVREKKDSVLTRPLRTRIKEKDLALICSQFSIILGTGLPVMRCVEMVAAQNRNKHLARMLHKVAEDIGAGYSMAQSFETNIPGLPKTFVETVRAGEQSGALEACFKRLYKYYDKSAKTRAKIVSTMTYPVMVIVTAIIVFAIIMVVAVPAFTSAFADLGTDLPAVTRWLMSTSAFLTHWWWLILFILALLTIGYLSFKRTERGKLAIASYALRRAPLRRLHTLHLSGQLFGLSGVAHHPRGVRSSGALPLRRLRPCAGRPGSGAGVQLSVLRRQVPLLRRKALRPPCVGGADLCGGVCEPAAPI